MITHDYSPFRLTKNTVYKSIPLMIFGIVLAFFPGPASAEDTDPIRSRLDRAKVAYAVALEKCLDAIEAFFDKREEAARKEGNKKAVDQIKAERLAFNEKAELPDGLPPAILKQEAVARATVKAAFGLAVKEYTREKKDDLAVSNEKELELFLKENSLGNVIPKPLMKGSRLGGRLTWTDGGRVHEAILVVPESTEAKPGKPASFTAVIEWDIGKTSYCQMKMTGERKGDQVIMQSAEILKGQPFFPVRYIGVVSGHTFKGGWRSETGNHSGEFELKTKK